MKNAHNTIHVERLEDALTLSMKGLAKGFRLGGRGIITWTWPSGKTASIGYSVDLDICDTRLWLQYSLPHFGADHRCDYPVLLSSDPCRYGGRHWYFHCPGLHGRPCGRRVRHLHLPDGREHFACRHCHELRYRATLYSRRDRRLWRGLKSA